MPGQKLSPVLAAVATALLLLSAVASCLAQSDLASLDAVSIERKADAGDRAAQTELGARYDSGRGGVVRDYAQARSWYQKAAEQGVAAAQYSLGLMCEKGQGGPKDLALARQWYQKAADQGELQAVERLTELNSRVAAECDADCERISAQPTSGDNQDRAEPVGSTGNPAASGQNTPASQPTSDVVDVRFTQADSRTLSSAEMAALRDSLRWEPESARLPRGGSAVSYLLDTSGRKLGSIQVQWTKTVAPKAASSQSGGLAVGSFTFQIENETSCGFLGEAELYDAKGLLIVSSLMLDSWVGLQQPEPGQTIRVEGDAELPIPNPTITFRPIEVDSALSGCTTSKNPSAH